jgi:hypothetical protein
MPVTLTVINDGPANVITEVFAAGNSVSRNRVTLIAAESVGVTKLTSLMSSQLASGTLRVNNSESGDKDILHPRAITDSEQKFLQDLSASVVDPFVEGVVVNKWPIMTAMDFPTSGEVRIGWLFRVLVDVKDDFPGRTETGQEFRAGSEIMWNGSDWTLVGLALTSPFQFKGEINVAADFPTLVDVEVGWLFLVKTDVTDNDVTKTNTGQSFLAGEEIAWNGVDWTSMGPSSPPTFSLTFGRNNATAGDEWLRDANGIPSNLTPIRLAINAKIIAISASTVGSESWDAEIYDGVIARAGGTPSDAMKLTELVIAAADGGTATVDVDVAAGSELGVYARGTNLSRPRVTIWLTRRD